MKDAKRTVRNFWIGALVIIAAYVIVLTALYAGTH